MTVYVDDFRVRAQVGRGRSAVWSHLTADTVDELHAFAARLGLRRSWFQDPTVTGKPWPSKPGSRASANWHYDVTETKRKEAVRLGAVEVTSREMVPIITRRWMTLGPCTCGCPDDTHGPTGTHQIAERCGRGCLRGVPAPVNT
ncbi:MAG TPA: DUF4031 domain-containing protein [Actinomycetospora sp.]|jgi:hypothetical protein|uniref:DUF4031 domain-containing protein n=1 Tax=Actinomycetospora sp. TaxID=1872135 RepID=UPI002F419087